MVQKKRTRSLPDWFVKHIRIKLAMFGDDVRLVLTWKRFGITLDFGFEPILEMLQNFVGELTGEQLWGLLESQLNTLLAIEAQKQQNLGV